MVTREKEVVFLRDRRNAKLYYKKWLCYNEFNLKCRLNGGIQMAKLNWVEITKEDVVKAIEKFLNDNPEYPEPRSTFLVYEEKKLPAKHIRGMAYQEHYGVEIAKSEFGGGSETVRFFERLGFDMEYHGTTSVSKSEPKKAKKKAEPIEKKEPVVEKIVEVSKPKNEICEKEVVKEKIVIPSKKVIEQKNALQLILNRPPNCLYIPFIRPASISGGT